MKRIAQQTHNPQPVIPDAIYSPASLPEHKDNPLIEALPPFRLATEMVNEFGRFPHFLEDERHTLSDADRMFAIMRLNDYLEPLPYHFDIIDKIGLLIRSGYRNRNPRNQEYGKALVEFYRQAMEGKICPLLPSSAPTAPSASLFGVSGTGKSSVVERTLAFLPPMICHPKFGFVQIVWVKIDCPADGSLKQELLALLRKIDSMIGTNYRKELGGRGATVDSLILDVAKVLASHHCGVIVIDEIQNLLDANGIGQAKMINTLVSFSNEVKIPTITIGTPRALKLLEGTFREARRIGDHGSFLWDTLPHEHQYSFFLNSLWKYQWIKKPVEMTDKLNKVVHKLTQGIPVLMVRLFQLSQLQAIRNGSECLSKTLLADVAHEKFKLIVPMLKAMRKGDKKAIQTYEDLLHKGLKCFASDGNGLSCRLS